LRVSPVFVILSQQAKNLRDSSAIRPQNDINVYMIKINKIKINKKSFFILIAAIVAVGCFGVGYLYIHQRNLEKALSDFNNLKWEVPSVLLDVDNLSLQDLAPSDLEQNNWQPQITVNTNILPESDFIIATPEISLKTPNVEWKPNEAICQQFQSYSSCEQAPLNVRDVCQRCPKKK